MKIRLPMIAATAIILGIFSSGQSNAQPTERGGGQALAQADKQFERSFRDNIYKGCTSNRKTKLKNLKNYCMCYANSYAKRYSAQELRAIDKVGSTGKQAVQAITLMMRPEMKACIKSTQ